MLKAIDSLKIAQVASKTTSRQTDYFCPGCNETVVLKAGRYKIAHFAHKTGSTCLFGAGESKEHLEIKNALYEHLKTITPHVTVEQKIGRHITDVYAKIDGQRFCYEVQLSPISVDEIIDRMQTYSQVGAATVWVLFHKAVAEYKSLDGEEIKIKRWWMFLQKMQMGVTCFYDGKNFIFSRLGVATSWHDGGDYYDSYDYYLKGTKTYSQSPEAILLNDLTHRYCRENNVLTFTIPRDKVWWKNEQSRI